MVRDFLKYLPPRLIEYDKEVMQNRIFKARTKGVGAFTTEEAIEWGVTGPNLRACGFEWDFRKKQPYSGYEQFEFDIPTGRHGDCYDRAVVRVEEMRQSLRIIEQCVDNMPEGTYKSAQPLACPPLKERTMHDIETLITHFLGVSWGPVIPPGEALGAIEATKGNNGYYLISDGGTTSYRTRIRTPSFAHMQMLPLFMPRPDGSRLVRCPGRHGLCACGCGSMRRKKMLTAEERQEIEAELARYPTKEAVCIDAMKIVQRHRGWVSDESIRDIGELLEMSSADLDGVATFYNLIFRKPVGPHVIMLCDSVSCWIMGYDRIREHLTARLGIRFGETTADNRFTLLPIVCLGRVRARTSHDDRQRSSWEPRSGQRSTGSWRRASRHDLEKPLTKDIPAGWPRLSTSGVMSVRAVIKRFAKLFAT